MNDIRVSLRAEWGRGFKRCSDAIDETVSSNHPPINMKMKIPGIGAILANFLIGFSFTLPVQEKTGGKQNIYHKGGSKSVCEVAHQIC
jgi:hypothetical protein